MLHIAAPDPVHEQHSYYPPVPNFAIIWYSRKVCGQMEKVCEVPQHGDVYINHDDAVPLLLFPHSYLHPVQRIPACNASLHTLCSYSSCVLMINACKPAV